MKIVIPVAEDRGLESQVYGHFGSAPAFVVVDAETMSVQALDNQDQAHAHGQCNPLKSLAGTKPDGIIVGGIGAGALLGLRDAGIKVYQSAGETVAEAVALLKKGELKEVACERACAGQGDSPGCHHHHG